MARLLTRAGAVSRLLAVARLYRPLNLLGIAAASWVGALLARAPLEEPRLLVPALIGAFGYARNDAVDAEADRRNRPGRPIPSGALTAREASALAVVPLGVAAGLLAFPPARASEISIAAAAAALLALYSPRLTSRGPLGPGAIALLAALAVVWGGLGGAAPERTLPAALLAAAIHFARECVKHLEDQPGDRAAGRTTWAVAAGALPVRRAARVSVLASLLLLPLPWTPGTTGASYLMVAAPGAGIPLLASWVWLSAAGARYGRISAALKTALFAGLAALAVGGC